MTEFYLTDLSERDKPWDYHRALTDRVRVLYEGTDLDKYAEKMALCSLWLQFALTATDEGERVFRLQEARFCRLRHCPSCQWRRSLKWKARFLKALPEIVKDYPKARWLFLTLTEKNCPIEELRSTVDHLNQGWNRLAKLKQFPAIGFVKSVEVTKSKDGLAHPHIHSLIMVQPSYFKGQSYLSQEKWRELWQRSARLNYDPWVDVRTVKPRDKTLNFDATAPLISALKETLKYTVKGEDLAADSAWLVELTKQLHQTRAVSLGGVLREYLSDDDNESEDLIHVDEDLGLGEVSDDDPRWWFGWREMERRYKGKPKD